MQRDRQRLLDISIASAQIGRYIEFKSEAEFCDSDMLHDAGIMQLIVVGESVGVSGEAIVKSTGGISSTSDTVSHTIISGRIFILPGTLPPSIFRPSTPN
jgi:hypothetical protein